MLGYQPKTRRRKVSAYPPNSNDCILIAKLADGRLPVNMLIVAIVAEMSNALHIKK
jgi:hypothetical protein